MNRTPGIDVRWGFGIAIALGFLSLSLLASVGHEVIAVSGLLIFLSGMALALDYRNAIDKWIEVVQVRPRPRMDPRQFARLNGLWLALIGLGWLGGSVAIIVGI